MWESFNKNPVQYNLRKGDIVHVPPARYSCYGSNSLAFRGNLLWNSLPSNVKQRHNLEPFKLKLKNLYWVSLKLIQRFHFTVSVVFFSALFALRVLYF